MGAASPRPQWPVAAAAALAAALLAARVAEGGARMALLLAIGLALGLTLYHAAFGFTQAYGRLFRAGDTRGVRAQLVLLALGTVLFAPLLASGQAFGQGLGGAVAPAGVQVAVGAFLFGIGMQLGGGCGSGTLFTAGGGDLRLAATLAAFVAGSFWASLHMGFWQRLPALDAIALGEAIGWGAAAALQLAVLAALWFALRGRAAAPPPAAPRSPRTRLWRGPWPLLAGALALALLNAATLVVAGHPWTITWAFSLWGAKAAVLLGWDPAASAFWSAPFQRGALEAGILEDVTSVMDIGIVLGALAASALAGRFGTGQTLSPARVWAAAVLGGLLMGYGARIAFGCNIGAFFSGVASTSLHGWLWIVAALPGNWLGVKLRPRFGLDRT